MLSYSSDQFNGWKLIAFCGEGEGVGVGPQVSSYSNDVIGIIKGNEAKRNLTRATFCVFL